MDFMPRMDRKPLYGADPADPWNILVSIPEVTLFQEELGIPFPWNTQMAK